MVAVVGAVTALLAATIALTQNDIKKVLAYSTVSQLGYMFLACGVGAFAAGIFHLMTHAFFKALLFLGSGSVIHAMSGEQDMREMGGLRAKLPITCWTFLVGTLAIAGVFPLAGFFSKDEILWKAFSSDGRRRAAVGWSRFLAAGLTAFYMMRLVVLTFLGENRASAEVRHHIHESPRDDDDAAGRAGRAVGGRRLDRLAGVPGRRAIASSTGWRRCSPAAATRRRRPWPAHGAEAAAHGGGHGDVGARARAGRGVAGLGAAGPVAGLPGLRAAPEGGRRMRGAGRRLAVPRPAEQVLRGRGLRRRPSSGPASGSSQTVLWKGVDAGVIDGLLVNGSALVVAVVGSLLRLLQNGLVRFYAWSFTVGVAVFVVYLSLQG